jgi:hypothetical protein
MDFLALIQKIGFADVKLVAETGLNSTPKTRGILIRARKPDHIDQMKRPILENADNMGFYKAFALTALPSGPDEGADTGAT